MSKNEPTVTTITKYDVEAAIDEVENAEESSAFKYDFTVLSDPKNVRLSINGIARIHGDSTVRDELLSKEENEVPKILTMIYQELFPTFFLLSKTLNVSCPPHTIGKMGETPTQKIPESITDGATENEIVETVPDTKIDEDTGNEIAEPITNSDLEAKPENSTDKVELETPESSTDKVELETPESSTDKVELETPNASQQ
jgi:hypothetical protein